MVCAWYVGRENLERRDIVTDCILIYLPKPYLKNPDAQNPLGLLYLAASLIENNNTVEIKNYAIFSDDEAISDIPPANLYGITATSLEILHANRFARKLKHKYPEAKVVIGGPGVYAQEFVDKDVIDSLCYGDGERIIIKILEDAKNNQIKPVYYAEPIQNLDELPIPARHLLSTQGGDIFAYNKRYAEGESTIIISSRGCPMKCAFCSAPALTYNNTLRFRSPQKIAEEIRNVKKTYNIKMFRFSDDFFTANRKRVFELCDAIGPEDVSWRISCRVKPLDVDMVRAMKNAGLKEMSFGVESADPIVLKGLKKQATPEDNVKALELSAREGVTSRALMMIRTPFQRPETIKLNKEFLRNTPIDIVAVTSFVPIPGCDIWANPDNYNIEILNRDLDRYNFYFFGPEGRLPIEKIFRIKDRDIDEFHKESEEFRDWMEIEYKKLNKG